MGNILLKLKRFLSNKNTVTILCVIAGVAVLLFGYNYRVSQAVKPVSVPYALVRMGPKTKVESDDVGTIKVSGAFIEQNTDLFTSKAQIVNNEWYINKGIKDEIELELEKLDYEKMAIKNTQVDNINIEINSLYYLETPVEERKVIGNLKIMIGEEVIEILEIYNKKEIKKKVIEDYLIEFLKVYC